jgi:anti-sigma factor RsiW
MPHCRKRGMTHEEAIKTDATTAYVLGQLTGIEREDFESHMFECVECAEDVQIGTQLIEALVSLTRNPRKSAVPPDRAPHDIVGYVLGDMTGPARDAFEKHLPLCFICSQQVTIGKQLLEALRHALSETTAPGGRAQIAFQFSEWVRTVCV